MEIERYNLLNVGVGGQGVIRAAQILSYAALLEDYKVRTAETHGMAQRGGSVASYLRFGTKVEGPLVPRGKTDTILAFEASEAVRIFNYAGPKTVFLINENIIIPPMIHQMGMDYPDIKQISEFLKNVSQNIYFINADEMAMNLGNPRTMNVVMLGVLLGSEAIPLKRESLVQAILSYLPTKVHNVNKKAFEIGIEKGKNIRRDFNE
ncbi:MAG: indolepyruvate ferredoxin oxidoreductase subunit beta [Promethearchaeota archaeon Loki_b31]|nr:MAG: indolepyruvate ferredoxin oxidoreductase subunit beta [Candidatus Lokiarchaeota archaeon Loki_b31]